jgi:hypothetical protein
MSEHPVMYPGEEKVAFNYAIGKAISQWAHVEYGLFVITEGCFAHNIADVLSKAFFAIENFRSKLAFTDRAMAASNCSSEIKEEWHNLSKGLRNLSALRNSIAHNRAVVYPASSIGRRYALVPRYPSPRNKKANPDHPPSDALCVRDIDLAALKFAMASTAALDLYDKIGSRDSLHAQFDQQEPKAQSLAQLRRTIYSLLSPRA